MAKIFLIGFIFNVFFLFSQSKIEKFEYERKSERIISFSYKIEGCPKSVISQVWKTMVETNGGKSSFVGEVFDNYSAENVVFPSLVSEGELKLYFQVFDYKNDSLMVTNAFQKIDGQFILPNLANGISIEAKEIMLDFSFEVRKECKKYELSEAAKYAEDLHRKIYVLENQNLFLDKSIISTHSKIKKLDYMVKTLADQINFYEKKGNQTEDDFTRTKLGQQYSIVAKKHSKLNAKLLAETASINEYRVKKESNLDSIKVMQKEIESQKLVVESIRAALEKVKR